MLTIKNLNNLSYKTISFKAGNNNSRPASYQDKVAFNKEFKKFSEYGIDPYKIEVVADKSTINRLSNDFPQKVELLTKIIAAHEHASKALNVDNFSGRKFATNMMMKNGNWALGVSNGSNAENAICGERNALNRVFSETLEKMSLIESKKADIKKDFQVKYLAMASSKDPLGVDASASQPCGDCLNWLNEDKFFDKNTQIVSIQPKSMDDKTPVLMVKNLKQLLPYKGEKTSLAKDTAIEDMGFKMTRQAKKFIKQHKLSDTILAYTMIEAKSAYDKSKKAPLANLSEIKNASAVLMSDNKISSAYKEDWTRRWFSHPALLAISKVFQSSDVNSDNKVNAIAYYGEKDVPYITSLAKIAQEVGSPETLVLTIKDDVIQARTIFDYMPEMYVSSKR